MGILAKKINKLENEREEKGKLEGTPKKRARTSSMVPTLAAAADTTVSSTIASRRTMAMAAAPSPSAAAATIVEHELDFGHGHIVDDIAADMLQPLAPMISLPSSDSLASLPL